jgi:uncharacterized cupredoxin-like copper-binding protein
LVESGADPQYIKNYALAYKTTKLVTAILEQSIIPAYILNAPLHHEALNVLAKLMVTAKSEMAKVKAAETVLAYTKPPEEVKVLHEIGVKEPEAIADLKQAMETFAKIQLNAIETKKATAKDMAELPVINIEAEEVES